MGNSIIANNCTRLDTIITTTEQPSSKIFLSSVTVNLLGTFQSCEANYLYDLTQSPRRVLTHPSEPVYNSGFDNEKWDYIIHFNDIIGEMEGHRYLVLDLLGHGTFGQVVKCQNAKTKEFVAVKVIKNQRAYFNQSVNEVEILNLLNSSHDVNDSHHIVRMLDSFVFRKHLCVVTELLSLNLYEVIKQNKYCGISINTFTNFSGSNS